MTSSSPILTQHNHFPIKRLWQVGLLAALIAACMTACVSTLAVALFHVPRSFIPLNVGPTVSFAVLGVLGATLVFTMLVRFAKRPIRIFFLVAVLVLVLSFIPDLTILGNTAPSFTGGTGLTVGVLMLEHVLVALISVSMLTKLGHVRKE